MSSSPSITVFAGEGFLRSYSGTKYLLDALLARGIHVRKVYVRDREPVRNAYDTLPYPASVYRGWNLTLRGLRRFNVYRNNLYKFAALLRFWRDSRYSDAILITEGVHIWDARLFKRFYPQRPLLHFCQECYLQYFFPNPYCVQYEAISRLADQLIDVEPNRARVRSEKLGLPPIKWILPNTLPMKELPPRAPSGTLARLAGASEGFAHPVLFYAGASNSDKPFERMIDAAACATVPLCLVAFIAAPLPQVQMLREYARQRLPVGRCFISGPVARRILLASMWEAQAGLIDYSLAHDNSPNQQYCAPTKLYEYMANGLPILASNNDGLRHIVEGEEIGICVAQETTAAWGRSMTALLGDVVHRQSMSERTQSLFASRYCYEKLCESAVAEIAQLLCRGNKLEAR